MHNLTGTVHACVSTTRAIDSDRMIRHLRERFFEFFLNTAHFILTLPAIVFTAIVLNSKGNSMNRLEFHF
ncbi:hypothetical protein D3C78_1337840 [compost metagenome]